MQNVLRLQLNSGGFATRPQRKFCPCTPAGGTAPRPHYLAPTGHCQILLRPRGRRDTFLAGGGDRIRRLRLYFVGLTVVERQTHSTQAEHTRLQLKLPIPRFGPFCKRVIWKFRKLAFLGSVGSKICHG